MNSPNLSESTFADMEEKIKSLMNERSRRENELVRKKETLLSLWNALQTPLDDLDRNILTRLLEGPARLQRKTFEKADHEIQRQEKTKSRILKDLIQKKIEEIQMICGNGHLPIPNEVAALRHSELNEDRPGHFADTLTRLTRIQTEMTLLSERRSEILKEIHELESARSEIDWLNSYEHDGDRYKGRDCNKKLRRAIKAGKLREKMPALVEKLHLAISDWERSEQRPFVFDGVDYRTHVLERFELHAPLSARSGRKTPAGRRSAFPSYSPPIQSARGLSKQKTKPLHSASKSVCFTEGHSMIPRPQTSVGYSPSHEVHVSFKNARTDYHPLQEKLDQLLGVETSSAGSQNASISIHSSPNKTSNDSSEDEIMEDVVPQMAERKISLPPPRLNLNALNPNLSDNFSRRPTF